MPAYLVLNTGSSSIKCQLFDAVTLDAIFSAQLSGIGSERAHWQVRDVAGQSIGGQSIIEEHTVPAARNSNAALDFVMHRLSDLILPYVVVAIGHRIVHGGNAFRTSVIIDRNVEQQLQQLVSLAPLHQPFNLAGVDACRKQWPQLAQIACFDTAFHQTQPTVARLFALPRQYTDKGIQRYGFHGLSYQYISEQLKTLVPAARRVIIAHLGNGASLCALKDGVSIDTTMGFTALDGLMMGSRCGSLDAGVILHLMQQEHLSADTISNLLYRHSGLLGVSGISADMRELLASQEPSAQLAVELFIYRCVREIGALITVMGGIDGLVFTAGIGEHAAAIRARIGNALQWLGVEIDASFNAGNSTSNRTISTPSSRVPVLVIPTNEELIIARACHLLKPI
jgi:acetate kinase